VDDVASGVALDAPSITNEKTDDSVNLTHDFTVLQLENHGIRLPPGVH
jgi:hypothetical protein